MVAVGNGVDRIFRRGVETQGLGRIVAVDREVGSGERGRTERAAAHAAVKVFKARMISFEHPEEGHHPVRKEDGLARLHVGVARHDHIEVLFGRIDENGLQATDRLLHFLDFVAQVHLGRGGRLVVAAAAGVEPTACGTYDFRHALFNRHVNVFVLDGKDKTALADFPGDLIETSADRFSVFL